MPQLTKLNLKSSKIYKKKAWKDAFKYWQCGLTIGYLILLLVYNFFLFHSHSYHHQLVKSLAK